MKGAPATGSSRNHRALGSEGRSSPRPAGDVAIFDVDLVETGRTRPADLLKAKVLYTIVGGKLVYEARGPAGRQ